MRYMKKLIFLLPVMSLTILLIGCHNSGNENGYDTDNNEGEISQDAQVNDPDSDSKGDKEKGTISEKEAENILREYLVSANILKSDYVLEPFDPVLGEFQNEELFRFEMRHKEDADGYGGNLIANYAVSADGERIYWYNPADDELVLQKDEKEQAMDADVLSPIDGVMMEVLDCTDTSVTIKITNDTDKDINCGTDFHINILDEKTGEWRELDTVIDDAAFDAIAIMIKKDSPYETVIDFEWLYGKLKPGRYQIVKTVMDFRGTGDYTNYVYAAEFDI